MGAAVKLVIGLVLLAVGLLMLVDSLGLHVFPGNINWLGNFIIVLTGAIPIFLILLGLFVVWLEADEMKTNKEFKREQPKK